MNVKLPIYFTEEGRGWKYRPKEIMLKFENGQDVLTALFTYEHKQLGKCTFEKVNGYYIEDNIKIRVTNYVGFNGEAFLKICPHCGKIKPTYDFDFIGRYDETRDQSNCNECRGSY